MRMPETVMFIGYIPWRKASLASARDALLVLADILTQSLCHYGLRLHGQLCYSLTPCFPLLLNLSPHKNLHCRDDPLALGRYLMRQGSRRWIQKVLERTMRSTGDTKAATVTIKLTPIGQIFGSHQHSSSLLSRLPQSTWDCV